MTRTLFALLSLLSVALAQAQPEGWIVKFKTDRVDPTARRNWINNQLKNAELPSLSEQEASTLKTGWNVTVFDGFSGGFSDAAARVFREHEDVAYVERDVPASITAMTTQNNAPWGLQRISQRAAIQNGDPTKTNFIYNYDDSAGSGVDIYILDTGVRTSHVEFGGRATFARTFSDGVPDQDIQGHGTHVAGIAASSLHGVAKAANIIAVKVMDDQGAGSASNIISGINFVANAAAQSARRSVINLSITAPASRAIDAACANAVSNGVYIVAAAGNEGVDTSNTSPARSDAVIAVGATDIRDRRASFSNFGPAVDVFAPGVGIISLSNLNDNAVKTLDGTSMASPMVAGLVAYLLTLEGTITPAAMKQRLRTLSTTNLVTGLPSNTTNALVFNDAAGAQTTNQTPAIVQQQSILGSIDSMISAFSKLASSADRKSVV